MQFIFRYKFTVLLAIFTVIIIVMANYFSKHILPYTILIGVASAITSIIVETWVSLYFPLSET